MAYGLRFWHEATNGRGNDVIRVELHYKDWVGSAYEIRQGEYLGGITLRPDIDSVLSEERNVISMIAQWGVAASATFNLDSLRASGDDDIKITIKKVLRSVYDAATAAGYDPDVSAVDNAPAWKVDFVGYFVTFNTDEDYTPLSTKPILKLTAKDGLRRLADVDFPAAVTWVYEQRNRRVVDIVGDCLAQSELGLPFAVFLNTHDERMDTNVCPLSQVRVDVGRYEGKNYLEVLEDICNAWGLEVRQKDGRWVLMHCEELTYSATYPTGVPVRGTAYAATKTVNAGTGNGNVTNELWYVATGNETWTDYLVNGLSAAAGVRSKDGGLRRLESGIGKVEVIGEYGPARDVFKPQFQRANLPLSDWTTNTETFVENSVSIVGSVTTTAVTGVTVDPTFVFSLPRSFTREANKGMLLSMNIKRLSANVEAGKISVRLYRNDNVATYDFYVTEEGWRGTEQAIIVPFEEGLDNVGFEMRFPLTDNYYPVVLTDRVVVNFYRGLGAADVDDGPTVGIVYSDIRIGLYDVLGEGETAKGVRLTNDDLTTRRNVALNLLLNDGAGQENSASIRRSLPTGGFPFDGYAANSWSSPVIGASGLGLLELRGAEFLRFNSKVLDVLTVDLNQLVEVWQLIRINDLDNRCFIVRNTEMGLVESQASRVTLLEWDNSSVSYTATDLKTANGELKEGDSSSIYSTGGGATDSAVGADGVAYAPIGADGGIDSLPADSTDLRAKWRGILRLGREWANQILVGKGATELEAASKLVVYSEATFENQNLLIRGAGEALLTVDATEVTNDYTLKAPNLAAAATIATDTTAWMLGGNGAFHLKDEGDTISIKASNWFDNINLKYLSNGTFFPTYVFPNSTASGGGNNIEFTLLTNEDFDRAWQLGGNVTGDGDQVIGFTGIGNMSVQLYGTDIAKFTPEGNHIFGHDIAAITPQAVGHFHANVSGSTEVALFRATNVDLNNYFGVGVDPSLNVINLRNSGILHVKNNWEFDAVANFTVSPTTVGATASLQVPNWGQVQNLFAGGLKPGAAVMTVATTNIATTGLFAINGYTPTAGQRVLRIGQTDQKQNGVYIAGTGTWVRATDSDTDGELRGFFYLISNGTFSGYKFVNTNQTAITVGTTNITYEEFDNNSEIDPVFVAWRDTVRSQGQFYAAPAEVNGVADYRAIAASDIPNLDWSKITTGKPNTHAGYGITDYNSLWDDQWELYNLGTTGKIPYVNATGKLADTTLSYASGQVKLGVATYGGGLFTVAGTPSVSPFGTGAQFTAYSNGYQSSWYQIGNTAILQNSYPFVGIYSGNILLNPGGGNTGFGHYQANERIDVNGNIAYTGLLKPNGTDGTYKQLLGTNGTSNAWATIDTSYLSDWATISNTIASKQSQLNGAGFIKANGTSISYDNSSYEVSFLKNSAFNKNFGTIAGTVAEGNHVHLIEDITSLSTVLDGKLNTPTLITDAVPYWDGSEFQNSFLRHGLGEVSGQGKIILKELSYGLPVITLDNFFAGGIIKFGGVSNGIIPTIDGFPTLNFGYSNQKFKEVNFNATNHITIDSPIFEEITFQQEDFTRELRGLRIDEFDVSKIGTDIDTGTFSVMLGSYDESGNRRSRDWENIINPEDGRWYKIEPDGTAKKYLLEGEVSTGGGGTYEVPTLQEVSDQGASSTKRLQFNNVNYATMNDVGSALGFDAVLTNSAIANEKSVRYNMNPNDQTYSFHPVNIFRNDVYVGGVSGSHDENGSKVTLIGKRELDLTATDGNVIVNAGQNFNVFTDKDNNGSGGLIQLFGRLRVDINSMISASSKADAISQGANVNEIFRIGTALHIVDSL